MVHEKSGRWGELIFEVRDAGTGELVRRWSQKNMLTYLSGRAFQRSLQGINPDVGIAYFALGTGTAAPSRTDTALVNEQFRKQVTQQSTSRVGLDCMLTSVCSLSAGEANFTIREIGVFCGSGASGVANTGELLSRVLVNFTKNSNQILNIYRVDHLVLE